MLSESDVVHVLAACKRFGRKCVYRHEFEDFRQSVFVYVLENECKFDCSRSKRGTFLNRLVEWGARSFVRSIMSERLSHVPVSDLKFGEHPIEFQEHGRLEAASTLNRICNLRNSSEGEKNFIKRFATVDADSSRQYAAHAGISHQAFQSLARKISAKARKAGIDV